MNENAFTKPYSEETSKIIDQEVRKLIDVAYERTKKLLTDKKAQVEKLAEALLDKEVLFQSDVELLIGKRPYEEKKTLDVAEETVASAEEQTTVPVNTAKEDIKPIDEQNGNIGLAPSM
jgi:cell division protease FtsH